MMQRKSSLALAALATGALVAGLATPAWAEDSAPQPVEPQTTAPAEPQNPGEEPKIETPELGNADPVSPGADSAQAEAPAPQAPTTDAPVTTPRGATDGSVDELYGGAVGEPEMDPMGYQNGTRNARISGADRFSTAVAVSKHGYPTTAATVIVANGLNYPDALSAGALGAKWKAPLLLTQPGALPAATQAEIARLKPSKIVVVGGTGAVSAGVLNTLKGLAANVIRVSGADRYSTSIAIAQAGWPAGTASNVFLATGTNFADALAAGAAGGKIGAPVLLVPGSAPAAPASVSAELNRLGATKIRIAGGTGAISNGVQSSVTSNRTVVRYAGGDRFVTSARIATDASIYPSSSKVNTYWANGLGFADALAGGAVAGAKGSPLLLSAPSCVPASVYSANDRVAGANTYLLGGAGALGDTVLRGNECMNAPAGANADSVSGMQWLYNQINTARYSANLSGFRLADATTWSGHATGTPAYSWALRNRANRSYDKNPNLGTQQPWVGYEIVGRYNTYAGKSHLSNTWNGFMSNATIKGQILAPTTNFRGAVSVGYAVNANEPGYGTVGYSVIYIGDVDQS